MDKIRNKFILSSIALMLSFILVFSGSIGSVSSAFQQESYDREVTINFPLHLKTIGDSAFSGTALKIVAFGDNLMYISDQAFSYAEDLTDVYIPESVWYIGSSAFLPNVIIHATEGSYAVLWAEENGYNYVIHDAWSNCVTTTNIWVGLFINLSWFVFPKDKKDYNYSYRRIKMFYRSMRPQDRAELYPINYRFP